ncbi:hypothetical protein, partial [Lachnoclostridium sp.]|uniref:hypothetical protein n=1 Tax=Lachnoclostridium sp. TaxID=2028282 RepID=UPI00289775BD
VLGTVVLGTVVLGTVVLGTVVLGTVVLGTVVLGTVVLMTIDLAEENVTVIERVIKTSNANDLIAHLAHAVNINIRDRCLHKEY